MFSITSRSKRRPRWAGRRQQFTPWLERLEDRLAPALFDSAAAFPAGGNAFTVVAGDFNADHVPDLAVANGPNGTPVGKVSVLLGHGDGTFGAPTSFAAGTSPRTLAVADFDGDGKADLVVDGGANTISVLLGNGDGTFQPQQIFAVGNSPDGVTVGDFNGDHIPDIAAVNNSDNTVSVLLGIGDGGFHAQHTFAGGSNPTAVVAGDFNGDGKLDLAIGSSNGQNVGLLLGNGDGTFGPQVLFPAGFGPEALAGGDVNHDGKDDLIVANHLDNTVSVLLGAGSGFLPAQTFAVDNGPNAVSAGDFNGDGKLDLAVTNDGTGGGPILSGWDTVSILQGNGDGTFQPQVRYVTGVVPISVAPVDVNADLHLDLAVANFHDQTVSLLRGNGDGTFAAPRALVAGRLPNAVAAADFNHDGHQDLAVVNNFSGTGHGNVGVLLGRGDGTFGPQQTFATDNGPQSIAVADFNHDGNDDVVIANLFATNVGVLLGNGDGTFQPQQIFAAGANPWFVAVADFNGDQNPDLAVVNEGDDTVSVLLGRGDGTFRGQRVFAVGVTPEGLAVGDFNGDGKPDLAVANVSGFAISVLLGNGDGTFQPQQSVTVGAGSDAVSVADFNGDGKQDLVVANGGSADVSVLLGNGDGTFQPQQTFTVGASPVAVVVADFDGDHKLDVAVANSFSNSISALLGNGDGTFQAAQNVNMAQEPTWLAAADFNTDGKPDLVSANTASNNVGILLNQSSGATTTVVASAPNPSTVGQAVTFTATVTGSNPGHAPTGTVTFLEGATVLASNVPLSNGTADFVTSTLAAGSHTITAAYNGDSNNLGSVGSITQQVDKLASTVTLTTSGSPSIVGQLVTFTVTVTGAGPIPTGVVRLTIDGATTNLNLDGSGVATPTFPLQAAGMYFFSAEYLGDASYAGSSSATLTQVVNPAVPTVLLTSSGSPSTVGQPVTFTATVTGAGLRPTGVIKFQDLLPDGTGIILAANVPIDLSGAATFTTSALTSGAHTVTALYAGDSNYTIGISNDLTQQVNPSSLAASTVALTTSGSPSIFGQATTFTATVSSATGAGPAPTGSVDFLDGTAILALNNPLDGSGHASFSTSALAVGTHSITALYHGDGSYAPSTSAALTQVVNPTSGGGSIGAPLWVRQFGDNACAYGNAVYADSTGVYIAGYTDGALPGQNNKGGNDAFVTKYDTHGNQLWIQEFGSAGPDVANAVTGDNGGFLYVAGLSQGQLSNPSLPLLPSPYAFVAQLDPATGHINWTRQFGAGSGTVAYGAATDHSGNVYVVGHTEGNLFGQGFATGGSFVVSYNSAGLLLWVTQNPFINSTPDNEASAVTVQGTAVYIAGNTRSALNQQSASGLQDAYVAKLNLSDGSLLWVQQFGSVYFDEVTGIASQSDGVYITGNVREGLLDVEPGYQGFLIKYDPTGVALWTRHIDSPGNDHAQGVAVDTTGTVYVTGWTDGTLPGQVSAGGADAFLAAYDRTGALIGTRQFGSPGNDHALGVSAIGDEVYVAGSTDGAFPGQNFVGMCSDAFVARFHNDFVAVPVIQSLAITSDDALGLVTPLSLLTAQVVAADPGGQTVRYTYEWSRNGLTIPSATGPTLDLSPISDVRRGDTITLTVFPADDSADGPPASTTLTVSTDMPGGIPALSITDVRVNEASNGPVNAVFTITLSAASSRTVTVQVQTRDGTAMSPREYQPLSLTTLTFAPGQMSQNVTIPVMDNQLIGGAESFFVELVNPSNATLANAEATGTIINHALVMPPVNELLIQDWYLNFLGRLPDTGDQAHWQGLLDKGASPTFVVQSIMNSLEFATKQVQDLYAQLLGRPADPAGLQGSVAALQGGLTSLQLEALILASPEYMVKQGGTLNGFLQGVYHDVLQRQIDSSGAATWTKELAAGVSPGLAAYQILTSAEAIQGLVNAHFRHYLRRSAGPEDQSLWVGRIQASPSNALDQLDLTLASSVEYTGLVPARLLQSEFLTKLYHDLLGRSPDAGGFAHWLGVLDQNTSREFVVLAFVTSPEYRQHWYPSYALNVFGDTTLPGLGTLVDARVAAFAGQDFGSGRGTQTNNFLIGLFADFLGEQVDPVNPQNNQLLTTIEMELGSNNPPSFTSITYVVANMPDAGTFLANQYFEQFLGANQQPDPNEPVAIAYPALMPTSDANQFGTILFQFINGIAPSGSYTVPRLLSSEEIFLADLLGTDEYFPRR
jgi:uncharacterized repeat protein (TIGR01451 family)